MSLPAISCGLRAEPVNPPPGAKGIGATLQIQPAAVVIGQNLLHLRLERDQREALTGFAVSPPTITIDLDQQALLSTAWFAWSGRWWPWRGLAIEQITPEAASSATAAARAA